MNKGKEDKSKQSLFNKITKQQVLTIAFGLVAISLLLSGAFAFSGKEALNNKEELLEQIDELRIVNKTLDENNKVLKNALEDKKLKDSDSPSNEEIIEGELEYNEYDPITRTVYGDEFPTFIDNTSKDYIDQSFMSSKLLFYAYSTKLQNEKIVDGFSKNAELRHIYFIDMNHCFVQLIEGNLIANIIYKLDTRSGEIKFNEVSFNLVSQANLEAFGEVEFSEHFLIRYSYDINTSEYRNIQTFGSTFFGGRFSPNNDYGMQFSLSLTDEELSSIDAFFKDFNTGREVNFDPVTNESSGLGLWKSDSTKVLIDETRIYDVINDEVIKLEPVRSEDAIFEMKENIYDKVVVTDDYICINQTYNIRETSTTRIVVEVYNWQGQYIKTILVSDHIVSSVVNRNSISMSNASTDRNLIVIEEKLNLQKGFLIDIDNETINEVKRELLFIPELEWYVDFRAELNNQLITEYVDFYNFNQELQLSVATDDKRIESYFGQDLSKDLLYFRRYTDSGFGYVAAINYVTGEFFEFEPVQTSISVDGRVIPYAYSDGRFEVIELTYID